MAFNENLPKWDNVGVEPPESKKTEGWQPTEKPPAQWFNWIFNRIYKVVQELQNKAVEKETGKGLSTNDYTTVEKTKLADIEIKANKTVITNNLTEIVTGKALDATQGKVLNDSLVAHKAENASYITNVTRDISLAGEQSILLLSGRKAKKVIIYATINFQPFASWGFADYLGQRSMSKIETNIMTTSNASAIRLRISEGNEMLGTVTIESGLIKINWVKTGNPTGIANLLICADYHD